jgi:glycerol-3-phosphate dehydrogenase (NAD(P)+)
MALGVNSKAFVATVALGEMSRIVQSLGGRAETVLGLAGLGDLITTGFSAHSRNRTLGEKLAGGGWEDFLEANTVEGVPASKAVGELVTGRDDLPLFWMLHDILRHHEDAPPAMRRFLAEFSY